MSFASPSALWWLLPLGAAIVFLYLLRMRRKRLTVPAVFLWPERTDEVRANAPIQRLRFNWLLVLQLLALALAVTALAVPQYLQRGLAGNVTVFVVDASASMTAIDVGESRFETAKEAVSSAMRAADPQDQIAVIEAGVAPRIVVPLSTQAPEQVQRLEQLRASHASGDVGEALRLASAIVGKAEGAEIVLLSDGVFEAVEDFGGAENLTFQQIGETGRNVGVETLGATQGTAGSRVYVGLRNHGEQEATVDFELWVDGERVDADRAVIPAGENWGKERALGSEASLVEARVVTEDALAADNYRAAVLDPGASLSVLLVSNGNLFLERALALDPRVTLDRTAAVPESEEAATDEASRYDLIVFDGVPRRPVKTPAVLAFGSDGDSPVVEVAGEVEEPRFLNAVQHPLTEGVDFSTVYVREALAAEASGTGRGLVEASSGEWVVASEATPKEVFVAFDPRSSDFPLQAGFPIFIANCLDFFATERRSEALVIETGRAIRMGGGSTVMTRPDGEVVFVDSGEGSGIVRGFDRVGRYELDSEGETTAVYAVLEEPSESAIAPRDTLEIAGQDVTAAGSAVRLAEFWRPLLLVGLLVLAGEWWLFARRS
jgi:hypothetical protein